MLAVPVPTDAMALAAAPRASSGIATTIVLAAGMRGVGTSLTAGLLAGAAAELAATLLVDASGRPGLPWWRRGVRPRADLALLAEGRVAAAAVAAPAGGALEVACGGWRAGGDAPADARLRRDAAHAVRAVAAQPIVVLDAGTDLRLAAETMEMAPDALLLLVTGADAITLAATHAALKALRRLGVAGRASVVAARQEEVTAVSLHATLAAAAERFIGSAPPGYAGAVADDPCLTVALRAGMVMEDATFGSPARASAAAVARRLLAPRLAGLGATGARLPAWTPADGAADDGARLAASLS